MSSRPKLVVLPGDGVGPEVIAEATRVLNWLQANRGFDCEIIEHRYGFHVFRELGTLYGPGVIEDAQSADAVLFGAMGGPEYDEIPPSVRRQGSVLRLRRELKLFANLRPSRGIVEIADAVPFKRSIIEGVDNLMVREANGGIYFGEPRGIETLPNGFEKGFNTMVYETDQIERVSRAAFEIARTRSGRLCSVDKSNVLEVGVLWRKVVERVHRDEFPDVELTHMLVDNCAMQLSRNPRQFDVLVTTNMFGDILSDAAAAIMGSLGMAPSAALSAPDADGRRRALYEPVHGSAPDITGQGIANPIAAIWSLALAMRHSFHREDDAALIETAMWSVLGKGIRTADIAGDHSPVCTSAMGDAILTELDQLNRSCSS
ncbi:MAG TPA: 3-isopropylmalate dehydrogenase [Hyphomicrobiaceae bacterium]|nr:3-isopropylmalate dehydrogenase [Hyphomicrobiaceae bacterium]